MHSAHLVKAGVHAAVGAQADEMHCAVFEPLLHVLPASAFEERAICQAVVHEPRTLVHNLAGAEGVVAHFGVAHVCVRGQADCGAMRPHCSAWMCTLMVAGLVDEESGCIRPMGGVVVTDAIE